MENKTLEVVGKIEGKEIKEGNSNGKDWKRAVFTVGGKKYSTFQSDFIDSFDVEETVKVGYVTDGRYNNVKYIELASSEDRKAQAVSSPSGIPVPYADNKDRRISRMASLNSSIAFLEILYKADPKKVQDFFANVADPKDVVKLVAEDFFKYTQE